MTTATHPGPATPPRQGWAVVGIALCGAIAAALSLLAPILAILAAGSIGIVVLGLARPASAFALLVFLVPMLSSVARGRFLPLLAPNEILLLTFAGLLVLRAALLPRRLPPHAGIRRGFILFTLLGAMIPLGAFVLRGGALSGADIRESLVYLQYYVLFLLGLGSVRSRADIALVLRALMISSVLVSVLGVLQVMQFGPALSVVRDVFMTPDALESHGYLLTKRATSTLGAWNGLAVYLSVIVFLALSLFYVRPREGEGAGGRPLFGRRFLGIVLVCDMAGIVATGSHTGLLTLGVGVSIVLAGAGRARHLLGWSLLMLPGLALVWEAVRDRFLLQFSSGGVVPLHLLSRWYYWQLVTGELTRGANLLFGIRPSIPPDAAWITEDSYYLHLLARGGIFFAMGFLLLGVAFVRLARRARRSPAPLTRAVGLTLLATLAQLALIGLTGTFFRFSGYAEMIWILAAFATIGLAMDDHAR